MNTEGYNKAVDTWGNRLYLMIYKNLRDVEESENLVQDAFETLWINREKVEEDKVKSFLFTTSYRQMIDHIRKNKRFQNYMSQLEIGVTSDTVNKLHAKEILEVAFEKLSQKFKNVILLRDQEGYSYDEIAEITGQTTAQVRTNIFRGRKILKDFITQLEDYRVL